MDQKSNPCIACSVEQCAHNALNGYCALEQIRVGTHEANPTVKQCVDCESFEPDKKCEDCHCH